VLHSGRFHGRNRYTLECESGIVEVQRNEINVIVLGSVTDLVGKVERRPRQTRIAQQMVNKMNERRKCQNAISEVGRKNCSKLSNLLKRTTDKQRNNTLRTYVASYWNYKEQDILV